MTSNNIPNGVTKRNSSTMRIYLLSITTNLRKSKIKDIIINNENLFDEGERNTTESFIDFKVVDILK